MLVDKSDLNFGKRSWRYSMLVRDGTIEKMFIEPQEPGDPFKVSDADTMLNYINPKAKKPDQVAILTREGCSFCAKAKQLLADAGYDYAEIPLPHTIRTKAVGAIAGAHGSAGVRQRRLIGGAKRSKRSCRRPRKLARQAGPKWTRTPRPRPLGCPKGSGWPSIR